MKKRAVLIGLGTISQNYFLGLCQSPDLELVAVCDINPSATGRGLYGGLPFISNYREAMAFKPEFAVICTAPSRHYEIADYFLNCGVGVIVEKPATTDSGQLKQLVSSAKSKGLFFDCVFHWQYGSEIFFLKEFVKPLGKPLSASSIVFDPYTSGTDTIKADKTGLCGAWFDSGINILSMLSQFVNIDLMRLKASTASFDKTHNLPCFVNLSFLTADIPVNIIVNWNTEFAYKKSTIAYENGIVDIFHSQQAVYFNGEKVFENTDYPRLTAHYRNYFLYGLPNLLSGGVKNRIIETHKPLFEVGVKLKQ